MNDQMWSAAPLVAVDLRGTGAQYCDNEAILEIGVVSPVDGRPERHVMHRPWSPPGLTNEKPALGPKLRQILSELAAWLDGTWIVGHTVSVTGGCCRCAVPRSVLPR
ncbi:hypothetical protein ABZT47_28640 [Sphaerisporangium sp. NPDC005289]|uniref:hypothetical protein n=1 Tax=Sphaerisporangium sp. NPDC005289 TaxID=3155247 RepID=UPI0033A9FDB0